MGDLYRSFATLLQALLIIFGTLFYITSHPETLRLILEKSLQGSGATVKNVEGSLPYGLKIYGFKYKDSIFIERVKVRYSLLSLISLNPTIDLVDVYGLKLYPERFEKEDEKSGNKSGMVLPPLVISNMELERGVVYTKPLANFDAAAKNITLRPNGVLVEKFLTDIDTEYGRARMDGSFKNMILEAKGDLKVAKRYSQKLSPYLENAPERYPVQLRLDQSSLRVSTTLKEPLSVRDVNVSLSRIRLSGEYLLKERYLKAKASYDLSTTILEAKMEQSAVVTLFGAYALKSRGTIVKSLHRLPFKKFDIDAAGDKTIFMADTYAGPYLLSLYSSDYEEFALNLHAKPHKIDYIENLPQIFSNQYIEAEANATAHLLPELKAKGVLKVDGNYSIAKSYFEVTKKSLLMRSEVKPKERRGGIWENLPDPLVSDIVTFIYLSGEKKIFNLISSKATVTLFEKSGSLNGWADIGSLVLEADGRVTKEGRADIDFDGHIDSLHKLLNDFNITTDPKIDAQIKSRFHLSLGEDISLQYKVEIPWYLVETDSQHIYYGLDSKLAGSIEKNLIRVDSYTVGFKDRRFEQKRPSSFRVDENLTIYVDELAILDSLSARGLYELKHKRGSFSLRGKNAHYKGVEGSIEADVDISASISEKMMEAEGEIFVKDALITYRPKKDFRVEDEDIVIIQDIKEPSRTKKALNIHIYSKKPLKYEIPEVSADFIPDITLWKESGKPLGILGMVKITEGSIDAADKHFKILPSEIYFGGSNPINPYLDLHIGYELDFYRFNIYVSHTLSKPLFLFSSEPPMSQNDIMSYILFGAPADETFGRGGELSGSVASLLLGSSLKKAIGGATGVRFDTLNILSTPDGKFGIEIGKRIGKRLRILYRNDTVSSFIIQYRASRSIRVDIDVKDTGQGINILYVKDIGKIKGL